MSDVATLLIRLEGPLQSWGYRSRFSNRDTGLEPSKSGVIGLLCCALGRDRSVDPIDLAQLKMHVRVDRQGRLLTDFHSAGGGIFKGNREYFPPTSSGVKGKNPVIMQKHYLADASFVVAIEGDPEKISVLSESLCDPVWPLSLGRRSCPPSSPVFISLVQEGASIVLPNAPSAARRDPEARYLWEVDRSGRDTETRNDVPVSWADRLDRIYSSRYIRAVVEGWQE